MIGACVIGLHLATHHIGHSYYDEPGPVIPGSVHYVPIPGADGFEEVRDPDTQTTVRKRRPLHDFNPGAWVNCGGPTAGIYVNSVGHLSAYAGWTLRAGSIDVTTAMATGYGKPRPVLVPSMRVAAGLRVAVFPPLRDSAGGVHFMWEF